MLICFNGVDGSGKSMQAEGLVERLRADGHDAVYVWAGGRSALTRPLITLGKRLLGAPSRAKPQARAQHGERREYQEYLGATGRLFRHRALRGLWTHISLAEHTAEIRAALRPHLRASRIVVSDRYIYDTLVGIAVLSGLGPEGLKLPLPFFCRVPQPTAWFLLDVPPAVAYARKDDIPDIDYLRRRVPLYRALASRLGIEVLDGTAAPDTIAAHVWERVSAVIEPARARPHDEGRVELGTTQERGA